jgi:hypothetical protein
MLEKQTTEMEQAILECVDAVMKLLREESIWLRVGELLTVGLKTTD